MTLLPFTAIQLLISVNFAPFPLPSPALFHCFGSECCFLRRVQHSLTLASSSSERPSASLHITTRVCQLTSKLNLCGSFRHSDRKYKIKFKIAQIISFNDFPNHSFPVCFLSYIHTCSITAAYMAVLMAFLPPCLKCPFPLG